MSPNVLSRQQKAQIVTQRLAALQEQRLELELVMLANDDEVTDPVPGMPPKMEAGQVVYEDGELVFPTYTERLAELDAAEARVIAKARDMDVWRLVEAMVNAQQAAQAAADMDM